MPSAPPRPYGWRVRLSSGDLIEEFPEDGSVNRWDDLPLHAVEELALVDAGLVREADPVVRWRLANGALWIRGHAVDVLVGPAQLTRTPGNPGEPVQKKKASSTYRPGQGATQRLLGFLVGCRRELEELDGARVSVLAKVSPEGEVGLRIDVPEALSGCGVALRIDGEIVHSRERFRELIAPPEGGPPACP